MKQPSSLQDFWGLKTLSPEGILIFEKDRAAFVFEISGIDPMFYGESDWSSVSDAWRSITKLDPNEEVQIVFSKTCRFDLLIEEKLKELELADNPAARRLLMLRLNSFLGEIDPKDPKYFSTKIYWTHSISVPKSESPQSDAQIISQMLDKRNEQLNRLRDKKLGARILNGDEVKRLVVQQAQGQSYLASDDSVAEWPSVDIGAAQLQVGDETIRCLHLKAMPERFSQMGMILALTTIPASFDLTLRLVGKSAKDLYAKLDRKRRVLFGMQRTKKAGDLEADARFQELNDILSRLNQSSDSLLSMGLTVCVRGPKSSDYIQRWTIQEIIQSAHRMGFSEMSEPYLGTFDCFLESLPSFRGFEMCNQTVLSSNAVHFLPLYQTARGDQRMVATFRTLDGGVFSIDPTSTKLANYNWLISGTSGSGKSFLVNSILLQSQSLNPRIFIMDVGGSYLKLTNLLEGEFIDFDTRREFALSPFFIQKTSDVVEESKRREHIQMVFWEMLRDEDKLPSIHEKAELKEVLTPLFDADVLPKKPVSFVRDELKARGSARLALLLDRWCSPQFFGNFLDTDATISLDSPLMTFDLKGLGDFADLSRVVQLILCSSLWANLRKHTDQFTFVVLDEVAFTLLRAQPSFVDELISTVRKYNSGVMIITQDLEKITSNLAGASILQNTQIKVILQQRGDPKNFSEPLQLSQEELNAIGRLQRRKGAYSDAFLIVDDQKAVIRYTPNLAEYLLATSVPEENRNLQNRMNSKTGAFSNRFLEVVEEMSV